MSKKWVKVATVIAIIMMPIIFGAFYKLFAYPNHIHIATGPKGGLYLPISEDLAQIITEDTTLNVGVDTVATQGSVENLLLLENGEVDFALYQPGTLDVLTQLDQGFLKGAMINKNVQSLPRSPTAENIRFVGNLYSQPVHFIVRREAGFNTLGELVNGPTDSDRKANVYLGMKNSGDYAVSLALLSFFDLNGKINPIVDIDYATALQRFEQGTLDATFITVGVEAKIYLDLYNTGKCKLLDIPNTQAFTHKFLFAYEYKIPQGLYGRLPKQSPDHAINTIAIGAQLLTHKAVDATLVTKVTELILNENFAKRNNLSELFSDKAFAKKKPEFTMHRGAKEIYEPGLHPLLPSDFVESIEGMRSFVVSILIATFLFIRYVRQRIESKRAHHLDHFMKSLLAIEHKQLSLDSDDGKAHTNDLPILQDLLDQVTFLRQEALEEISANELNENSATTSFIHMCHALSNKINAKISRQRLDLQLKAITKTITQAGNTFNK